MLLACERLSPDQKDELKLKSEEFATFLNDNYAIGDSVYFQNWQRNLILNEYISGETRGFVVTENYVKPFEKTVVGIQDALGLFSRQEGYKLVVVLQDGADKLYIELTCGVENGRVPYSGGVFLINDMKADEYAEYGGVETTNKDILSPKGEKAYCNLQRNVGIINWSHWDKGCTSIAVGEWRLLE